MKKYEDYVKNVLGIPYCNFEGVDPRIAYEIIVGFSEMYKRYPFFKKIIYGIEQIDDNKDHFNLVEFSDINFMKSGVGKYMEIGHYADAKDSCFIFNHTSNANNMTGYYVFLDNINKNSIEYFSFVITNLTKEYDVSKILDLQSSSFGRLGVFHEVGHLLDMFLHISNSDEFKNIIEGHDIESEITDYATTSNRELFAEAFMFYIYSTLYPKENTQTNELIQSIGKLVDERYKKFVTFRQLNFLNKKYDFTRRFTFVKPTKLDYTLSDLESETVKRSNK